MKILITGGLGAVGRPLVQRLADHGHFVRVMDLKKEADSLCRGAVECVTGDVTDFASVREHVRGMDAVVHLAALTYPAAGPAHEIYRLNCGGTFNVYEAAAQEGIRRVVCASSINALGFNFGVKRFPILYFPVDEAHPIYTTDAYSFSKQIVEQIGAYYWRRDGISGTQLRLPFVYSASGDFAAMAKKFMKLTQAAFEEFMQLPASERQARADSIVAQRDQGREQRMSEQPWEEQPESDFFENFDPLMMGMSSYTDFWAIIGGEDSAQAFEKSLTAAYDGSHPLFVCEGQNAFGLPSETLARLFFPSAEFKHPLVGAENLLSFEAAQKLIGFAPEHFAREWLE